MPLTGRTFSFFRSLLTKQTEVPFGDPYNKEYIVLGSILRVLLCRETTMYSPYVSSNPEHHILKQPQIRCLQAEIVRGSGLEVFGVSSVVYLAVI